MERVGQETREEWLSRRQKAKTILMYSGEDLENKTAEQPLKGINEQETSTE